MMNLLGLIVRTLQMMIVMRKWVLTLLMLLRMMEIHRSETHKIFRLRLRMTKIHRSEIHKIIRHKTPQTETKTYRRKIVKQRRIL
jgi:hypothetical protein